MNAYDIIFMVVLLISILAGIGLGVHVGFRLAQDRYEGKSASKYRAGKKLSESKRDVRGAETESRKSKHKSGDGAGLSKRMKRQDELSFAEFECQFTGEDPAKKLERVRGEQDAAYNCLEKKAEQG